MLRPSRLADMTRLSQTLMHVKNVHWIVIEDGDAPVAPIKRLLIRSGIEHTYLAKNGSEFHEMAKKINPIYKGKAWAPRNTALEYVRQLYGTSYDLRIFHDYLPKVKSIGLWAVGLSGKSYVEAPKVKNNTIVGWFVYNGPERQFGIDMAGFAVNLNFFLSSNASFHAHCNFPEDCFLSQFKLLPSECQVFVAQHCLGTSGTQKKEEIIVSEEPEHDFDLNEPWVEQQNDNDILETAKILFDLNEPAAPLDEEKDEPAPKDDKAAQDEEKDELAPQDEKEYQNMNNDILDTAKILFDLNEPAAPLDEEKDEPAPQDDEAAAQDEEKAEDELAPQDEKEYQNMNALASSSNQKDIEQPNPSEKAQLEYSTITTEKNSDDKHDEAQNIDPLMPSCASSSKNGTSKDGIGQEMPPEARHRKRRGADDKNTHNIENSVIGKTTQDGQQSRTNEKLELKSQEGSSTSQTASGRRKYIERSSSSTDQFSTNSEKNLKGKKAKTTKPSRLTTEKQKIENENSQVYSVEKILAMYSYGKGDRLYFVDWQGYIDEESWIRAEWMSTQELVANFVENCTVGSVAQALSGNENVPEHIAENLNKNEQFLKLMQTMGKDPTKMKTTKLSFAMYITPKQKEKAIASIDKFLKAEQISK
uniref:Galactosylgalactosylxylosylprotein 3-beta-glucuronosyltransferase n=1 Tax=Globodera rostochiensis TaxID=31243 RepID=A0A914HMQ2_GLORO